MRPSQAAKRGFAILYKWVETVHQDSGLLGLTTKNIYYAGNRKKFRVRYDRIMSFAPDPVQITGSTSGQQRTVRREILKFRWSLECPGCGFKVTGEGQPKPGQRLARCGRCKVVLVQGV